MVQLHYDKDEFKLIAKGGKSAQIHRPDGKKYLVCHVSKFKQSDVVGMYKHIQREMNSTTNEDIECDKTALNYDLSGFDKKTMNYSSEVKKRLSERFKGQRAIRKDATVMVGVIVSATPELFDGMDDSRERQYFQTAYDFLADYFGRDNVISATVHKDEKTPHLHFNFVPLTKDGRLSAKELVNQQALLHLQENLPKELQALGFEVSRGLPSKQTRVKHESPRNWKIRTGKNELERAERLTARAKRATGERERITAETARTAQEQQQRIEQRERLITNLEIETNDRVQGNSKGRGSAEDRIPNGNQNRDGGKDQQNLDCGGFGMGLSDRGRTKQDTMTAFQKAHKKVKQEQNKTTKSKGKQQGGVKM